MKLAILFISTAAVVVNAISSRINHKGKDIFLNGINVAWGWSPGFCTDVNYLDPSCTSYDCTHDRQEFEAMVSDVASNGGNSIRFWIFGDGNTLPVQNGDYNSRMPDHITTTQLNSIQWVLDLGSKYNILFNLCVWSFDMVNDNGYGSAYGLWNKIVTDDAHMDAFFNNWLGPLVTKVKDHYNLLSFEVFNEPEGMITNWGWTACKSGSSDCAKISIQQAQRFANKMASAIHTISSSVKVTVGSWSYIGSSNVNGNTNIWSDSALIAAGGKANGVLDYYQIHYYNWAYPSNSPFVYAADHWQSSEKPHVIGEFPNDPTGVSGYIFESLYKGNYAGAWGWAYNDGGSGEFAKGPFLSNMQYMQKTYGQYGWPTAQSTCTDNYPYTDGYSCAQQASWGKCGQSFMASPNCDKSCGRCTATKIFGSSSELNSTVWSPPHLPHLPHLQK
jgi:hypothetical protein